MEYRHCFLAGEQIFAQGEVGDCAYLVESGRVELSIADAGQRVVLAVRTSGELFGEMSIIDDKPRSAMAQALEDCTLLVITRAQLNLRIEGADPILRMCMNVVLDHLRSTLRRLSTSETVALERGPQVSGDLRAAALDVFRLEQGLEAALARDEFELFYQPLVDFKTGGVAGYEALMRWRHPERGLVPPSMFIPAAERSGLITRMTDWALEEGCRAVRRLQDVATAAGLSTPLFMSVNFSARDFAAGDLLERIDRILARTGAAASQIKLEITETLLLHSPETARKILLGCRERGASVAIDDFGTGYSSLSYLQNLPADTLKIDQSFIRGLTDQSNLAVVRSIIALAHGLDMQVVAEGVEARDEANLLAELGCDYGQGYLFSRPLPEAEAARRLAVWSSRG